MNDNSNLRVCNKCNNNLIPIDNIKNNNSTIPWDEKQILYKCKNCDNEVVITDSISIFTSIISGFFIFVMLNYFLFNGLFEFIIYFFSQSFFAILGAIVLSFFTIIFYFGSILNIINAIQQIKINRTSPLVDKESNNKKNSKQIILALFLGILPIILTSIFAIIDYYFYDLNEMIAIFLIPVIFSPIFFAKKLKSTIINVFYATLFWITLVTICIYIFK